MALSQKDGSGIAQRLAKVSLGDSNKQVVTPKRPAAGPPKGGSAGPHKAVSNLPLTPPSANSSFSSARSAMLGGGDWEYQGDKSPGPKAGRSRSGSFSSSGDPPGSGARSDTSRPPSRAADDSSTVIMSDSESESGALSARQSRGAEFKSRSLSGKRLGIGNVRTPVARKDRRRSHSQSSRASSVSNSDVDDSDGDNEEAAESNEESDREEVADADIEEKDEDANGGVLAAVQDYHGLSTIKEAMRFAHDAGYDSADGGDHVVYKNLDKEKWHERTLEEGREFADEMRARAKHSLLSPSPDQGEGWDEYADCWNVLRDVESLLRLDLATLGQRVHVIWKAFNELVRRRIRAQEEIALIASEMYGVRNSKIIDMNQVVVLHMELQVRVTCVVIRVLDMRPDVRNLGTHNKGLFDACESVLYEIEQVQAWANEMFEVLKSLCSAGSSVYGTFDANATRMQTVMRLVQFSPSVRDKAEKLGTIRVGLRLFRGGYVGLGKHAWKPYILEDGTNTFTYRPEGTLHDLLTKIRDPLLDLGLFIEAPFNMNQVEAFYDTKQCVFYPELKPTPGVYSAKNCVINLRHPEGMRVHLRNPEGRVEKEVVRVFYRLQQRCEKACKDLQAVKEDALPESEEAMIIEEYLAYYQAFIKTIDGMFVSGVHQLVVEKVVAQNYLPYDLDLQWLVRSMGLSTVLATKPDGSNITVGIPDKIVRFRTRQLALPDLSVPERPSFLQILTSQGFKTDQRVFLMMLLGRLLVPHSAGLEDWIGSPIIEGQTGTGKSTIMDLMLMIMGEDMGFVKDLSADNEGAFALGSLIKKWTFALFCSEMTDELEENIGRATWLKILGREKAKVNKKFGDVEDQQGMNAFGLTNGIKDRSKAGERSRREFLFSFSRAVEHRSPALARLLKEDSVNLLWQFGVWYRFGVNCWGDLDLWDVAPLPQVQARMESDMRSNALLRWMNDRGNEFFYTESHQWVNSTMYMPFEDFCRIVTADARGAYAQLKSMSKEMMGGLLSSMGYMVREGRGDDLLCVPFERQSAEKVVLGIAPIGTSYPRLVDAMFSTDALVAMPLQYVRNERYNVTTLSAARWTTVLEIVKGVCTINACDPPAESDGCNYAWLKNRLKKLGCKFVDVTTEDSRHIVGCASISAEKEAGKSVVGTWVFGLKALPDYVQNAYFPPPPTHSSASHYSGGVLSGGKFYGSPSQHGGRRQPIASPGQTRMSVLDGHNSFTSPAAGGGGAPDNARSLFAHAVSGSAHK